MAKYDVIHSCGHSETVVLFGKNTDRERRIDYLERAGLCSECYAAKRESDRQAATTAAGSWSSQIGLIPLKGSEKQVAWAETIRQEKLTSAAHGPHPIELQEVLRYGEVELQLIHAALTSPDTTGLLVYADWCDENRNDDRGEQIRLAVEQAESNPNVGRRGLRDLGTRLELEAALNAVAVEQEAKWWIDNRNYGIFDFAPGGLVEKERIEKAAKEEAVQKKDDKIQAVRDEIRALFGELVEAKVGEWSGQKRVYLGPYGGSACYYVNASSRVDAGTFECPDKLAIRCASHLDATAEDAEAKLKAFCEKLAADWNRLSIR